MKRKIVINGTYFVCAIYINSKLIISCFKYELSSDNNNQMNSLNKYSKINQLIYDSISIFGLYDTEKDNIKILCQKTNYYTIECIFFEIIIEDDKSKFTILGNQILTYSASNIWSEKNCYFSKLISDKLLCCAITNYIQCYIIIIIIN